MFALVVFAACRPASSGAGSTDTAAPPASDTAPDGPPVPAPSLDADGVGAALQAALAWEIPAFPPLARTFSSMMAQGDGLCPPDDEGFEILTPGGCVAESGYVYSGAGAGRGSWADDTYTWRLLADMVITDPDGEAFEIGGDCEATVQAGDGELTFTQKLLGSYVYPPGDLWLGQGTSSAAWIDATFGDDGTIVAQVDGGYELGGAAVYFDALAVGGACGSSPTGGLRLRDADGYWYTLQYSDACDTCGEVVYAGEDLGPACVDPSAAFAALAADVTAYVDEHPMDAG